MKSTLLAVALLTTMLAGCVTAPNTPTTDPADAIARAKANTNGAMVKVIFKVCRVEQGRGREDGKIFLDSEADYRDPKSLNVVLVDDAASAVQKLANGDLARTFQDRKIEVTGYATRIQIGTLVNGRVVAPYYYQTQLKVSNPSLLRLVD